MSNQQSTISNQQSPPRGTVLVLVVVLLAMLAIMATTFVITTRIENVAAKNQTTATGLDDALDSVIAVIQATLTDDLWGHTEDVNEQRQRLLGLPADQTGVTSYDWTAAPDLMENEPWDAPTSGGTATYVYYDPSGPVSWQTFQVPVDGDPWLADIDPVGVGTQFTSLWQLGLGTGVRTENASGGDNNLDGTIDAGDYDSQLYDLSSIITGPDGITYRAAIRIVDTCAMINVNTAWQVPTEYAATPELFPGNVLAGASLYSPSFGYMGGAADDDHLLGRPPASATLANMLEYQAYYIFRPESPDWTSLAANFATFVPLDLSDELDLRYRWNQDTAGLLTALEEKGDDSTTYERFGNLRNGQPQELNRYMLTAYSFSRHIRRTPLPGETAADFSTTDARKMYSLQRAVSLLMKRCKTAGLDVLTADEETAVQRFVVAVQGSFIGDPAVASYADGLNDPNYHTWQYIANLVDYLDDDDIPTILDTSDTGVGDLQDELGLVATNTDLSGADTNVYGLEKHFAITEVVLTCTQEFVDNSPNPNTPATYRIDIELYNPWTTDITTDVTCEVYLNGVSLGPAWSGTRNITAGAYGATITFGTDLSISTDPTAYVGTLTIVTKTSTGIPEDTFHIEIAALPNDAATPGVVSWQRDTSARWLALSNRNAINAPTLGAANLGVVILPAFTASGYATCTTDATVADAWCDPAIVSLWETAGTDQVVILRNLADLLAVPHVGYVREATGIWRGIGDWLPENDNTVRFDIGATAAPLKNSLFSTALDAYFTMLTREDNLLDDNVDGTADDSGEMRISGKINVNTAPQTVLESLHRLLDPTVLPAPFLVPPPKPGLQLVNNRPFFSMSDLFQKMGGDYGLDIHVIGAQNSADDVVENVAYLTRFANLITTRSDTFVAYILLEAQGDTVTQQRWIVLFDRSRCNQPPLIWDTLDIDGDGNTAEWIENPAYRKPAIVAKMRVE